jgi:hypothetical protein
VGVLCASGRLALLPFGMVVELSLMWTNAFVSPLADVAVHAKDLDQSFRVAVFLQPLIKTRPKTMVLSMHIAVIVDMIERQEHTFRLATTCTDIATISLIRQILQLD